MMADGGNSGGRAFAAWAPPVLDSFPCMPASPLAPLPQLTAGLAALNASCSRATAASIASGGYAVAHPHHTREALVTAPPAAAAGVPEGGWTLPDGRLRVGTHLPLLARRYRYLGPAGEGASAQVVLAQDELRRGTPPVVLKIMRRHLAAAGQKEARALRYLSVAAPPAAAAHIVTLRGTFHFKGHFVLVLERLHGSLLDHIVSMAAAPPAARVTALRKIAQQLLTAVGGLHACGIVHADLKPDNVLLTRQPGGAGVGVKLADLGSCFAAAGVDTSRLSFELQTLSYRAPEASAASATACIVVSGSAPVGPPADMWSLGCILAEIALQRPLFPAHTPAGLLQQISAALWTGDSTPAGAQSAAPLAETHARTALETASAAGLIPQGDELRGWHLTAPPLLRELATLDRSLADLLSRLLVREPGARLGARVALQHAFLHRLTPLAAVVQSEAGAAAVAQGSASLGAAAGQTVAPQQRPPPPSRPAPRRGFSSPAVAAADSRVAEPHARPAGSAVKPDVPAVDRPADEHWRAALWLPGLQAGAEAREAAIAAMLASDPRKPSPAHHTAPGMVAHALTASPGSMQRTGLLRPSNTAAAGVPPNRQHSVLQGAPVQQQQQQQPRQQAEAASTVLPLAPAVPGARASAIPVMVAAAPHPPESSGCTTADAGGGSSLHLGGSSLHSGGSTADPQSTWMRLGPLIDEVSPTDELPQGARMTLPCKTPQQQPLPGEAAGSASSDGLAPAAPPRSSLHAGSTAPQAASCGAVMPAFERSLGSCGDGSGGGDDYGTTTAAHSAAVEALAALASSLPPRSAEQRQQQQRWRQQEAPAAVSGVKPRPHAAAKPKTPAVKRPRPSPAAPKGIKPEAKRPAARASPAISGKRRAVSAAAAGDSTAAGDSATATPLTGTPQRSLRDRQSVGSRKPWWQV